MTRSKTLASAPATDTRNIKRSRQDDLALLGALRADARMPNRAKRIRALCYALDVPIPADRSCRPVPAAYDRWRRRAATMTRIVTTHDRYKRPPRKRKPVAIEAPAVAPYASTHPTTALAGGRPARAGTAGVGLESVRCRLGPEPTAA
jgi:hypothetical protein